MSAVPGFEVLKSRASRLQGTKLSSLVAGDAGRAGDFALCQGALYFNFTRQS